MLIDAENIPARLANELFAAIAEHGEPIVRRIYGDFSDRRLAGWYKALARHALIAQQQFTVAGTGAAGKNAADIALVIDAMDMLHAGTVDGFCLVSGDADFTRLAARIREHGLDVFGFGGPTTPESFREACRSFAVLQITEARAPAPVDSQQPPATKATDPAPLRQAATQLLRRAIMQVPEKNGWRQLSPLGKALRDISPNFDPRHYGHSKLLNLVADTGAFELNKSSGSVLIRPRDFPDRH